MLQRLPRETKTTPEIKRFLLDLHASGFDGDTATDESSLAVASTDNSIWQVTPQVVLSPKSKNGVEQVIKLLSHPSHRSLSITPRGGGTSTAGQSLTNSMVLDCKRYMHRILAFDSEKKQIHVECGAVLQQVNNELQPHGMMLGPTVATASRATIGGMIGNDSAGKGSQIYGKTSDCVVSLETVIRGGSTFNDNPELVGAIKHASNEARPYLNTFWPTLPRFISGYNLPMAWDGNTFNSNRIFCGSEGTLGVTTSSVLQCVPIPTDQQLLLLCFDSFDAALRCGAELTKHKPTAIEVVDEMVLETARNDTSWQSIAQLLGNVKNEVRAILFVESNKSNQLLPLAKKYNPILARELQEKEEYELAWSFRSRSVGLLSSLKGKKRPVPFVEDCAVPPDRLADFILAFKNLLAKHDLRAGMFGHVDAGVMHVRPALNIQCKNERETVRIVSEEVASLVHSFGGVLWGEHGKGFRSEFGPQIFGEVIWKQMCNIKNAFDPYNQFNPGKVAVPNNTFNIATISTQTRGELDEQSLQLDVLSNATKCDGNSECQSFSLASRMCPTFRATDDPALSPRGRAGILRAWLRRVKLDQKPKSLIRRILNSGNDNDYNHDVKNILDSCISCKACATDCPMQIDIPAMRSQFYNLYFGRYLRPLRDIAFFNMERTLPIQRYFPSRFFSSLVGICNAPKPSYKFIKKIKTTSPEKIARDKPDVVLLQDSFTTYFRPEPFLAMVKILEHLGKRFSILPLRECGKALHVRGALNAFHKTANKNIAWLTPVQDAAIPIIGIGPAATLLWRDEYPDNALSVQLPQEWLVNQDLSSLALDGVWRLFPHCLEQSLACESNAQWKQIFKNIGSELEVVNTACCGMGGLFGHQKEFKQLSLDIWNIHWAQFEPDKPNTLVTGYSCQSQAKRIENITLRHPLEAIATSIRPTHLQ
jgi:FAD/FMN-containing dehydrogenase/Fe-S oxidoreductase